MHRTLTVLVLLVLVGGAHAADAGACYSIPDHDARAWCLARAHKDPSIDGDDRADDERLVLERVVEKARAALGN